jgi:TRAP transporter TAXI family solute receptor
MRSLVLASLPPLLAMSLTLGAKAAEKTPVVLGTATPGGGFPIYGQAVAECINEIDPTLDVRPQNTAGSTENIPLLRAGKLDIGLVQGEAALEALKTKPGAPAPLPVLFAMYATPGMFVVRADSPYHTIEDLRGKPVAFGAKGSGLVLLAGYVLDGLGYDRDRDGRGSVGRGQRLARVYDRRESAGGRALHRARSGRHQADHRQAPVSQDPDRAGGVVPGPKFAPRLGRVLELYPVAANAAGGGGLSFGARAP